MIGKLTKYLSARLYPPLDVSCAKKLGNAIDSPGFFEVLQFGQRYPAGFYMIECRVDEAGAGVAAQLSFLKPNNIGHYAEAELVFLPLRVKKLTKRIVCLSSEALGLQLELVEQETQQGVTLSEKTFGYLRLVPLRNVFARNRMLRRLHAQENLLRQRAERKRQPFANFLYTLYDRSFLPVADERYQLWIDYVEADQTVSVQLSQPLPDQRKHYFFCAPGYHTVEGAEAVLAQMLAVNPQAVVVYSDEDCIDQLGVRRLPWFKPAWNPDLYLAQDYISACYVCTYDWYKEHRAVFERFGPRLAMSYLLPELSADAVLHMPQVLVHREAADELEGSEVNWSRQRSEVLKSKLPDGVELESGLIAGSLRVRYPLPEPVPLVSLLIPTRDALDVLQPCVDSILTKTVYPNYEILILDNQSKQEETLLWLEKIARHERVSVLPYNQPFNYSAINNFGVRHAHGSVIGLINNDVEVISPDWLMEMVSQVMRPEIGCVGAKLYYSNDQIQHGGVILGLGDVAGHAHRLAERNGDGYHGRLKLVQNYSAVTAACLLVRRDIYEAVGGLEEEHLTVAYNDVDFCIRVREAGYRNLWTPYAELYHHESVSRGEDDTPAKKARYEKEVAYMQRKWQAQLAEDPCYNPNLCRRREDFSLPDVLF